MGQPSEDSDALLQTANPFPEAPHNEQRTSIRQSCSTMHDTNSHPPSHPPRSVAYCYHGGKTLPMPNPHLTASSIKGCARKTGSETMVTNARWKGGSELCQATCVHHHPYPHLSPRPLPPFFVHIWWRKICRPAALAVCHSGT